MNEIDVVKGGIHICRPPRLKIDGNKQCKLVLMSDLHIGAPHVDYKRIKKDLDYAKDNEARILINGDIFDMILPKDHKRYQPSVVHPRLYGCDDLISSQLDWGFEILAPYAYLIDMIGVGNHETSIVTHHSIDPIKELLSRLRSSIADKYKSFLYGKNRILNYGGYCGFVDYRLSNPSVINRSYNRRFVIAYHHGMGNGAPVTKGMIDLYRFGCWMRSDLQWLGHKHNRITAHLYNLECPISGDDPITKDVRQIMTGAYFDTYQGQTQESVMKFGRRSNYAADLGCAPQGKGGAYVTLCANRKNKSRNVEFEVEITQ